MPANKHRDDRYNGNKYTDYTPSGKPWRSRHDLTAKADQLPTAKEVGSRERTATSTVSEADKIQAERNILSPLWSYGVEENGSRAGWLFINLPQELIAATEAIKDRFGVTVQHGMYGATLRVSPDDHSRHIAPYLKDRS